MYRRLRSVLVITLTLVALVAASQVLQVSANQLKILEFDTVVGLPLAFTAGQNPIRNMNGGGLPWTIGSARGELTAGGHLEIDVQGLVFAPGRIRIETQFPASGRLLAAFRLTVAQPTS